MSDINEQITRELDKRLLDTAVRDGTAAGSRVAAYWGKLMDAGIPLPIAGGMIMQYQAMLLGSEMPQCPQRVEVTHTGGEAGDW
jgi:hypothetical protein